MRKFVQPVAMPCTWQQYKNYMHGPLSRLSAETLDLDIDDMKFVFFDSDGKVMWDFKMTAYHPGYHMLTNFNPELFLALAAMSKGPNFWPGEWVIDTFSANTLAVVNKQVESHKYEVENFDNERWTTHAIHLVKATKVEILDHFETALIASDIPEPQRFTIDQAKEIIAKALSIPAEKVEIDGR